MISKEASAEFLARKRNDWAWVKRLSRAGVIEELKERGFPRRFKTRPRLHQFACYLAGLSTSKLLLLLGMGLGKTKLVLDLFAGMRVADDSLRVLVLVPKKVHMGTWEEQVREHSDYTIEVASAESIEAKWEVLATSTADIVVIDYQGFGLATTRKVKAKGKGKFELVRDPARVRVLQRKYGFLALDEIHRVKNHMTLRFSILRQVVKSMDAVFGLTGTPLGRDPQALWAQFYLVDGGYALGESLGLFRSCFFTEKKGYFGGTEYKFDKTKQDLLNAFMRHSSVTYDEKECLDLPPVVPIKRTFRLTHAQRTEMARLKAGEYIEEMRVPIDGVFPRMREVTSGYTRKRVNGVQVTQYYEDNPKLDLFEADLLEVPADRKFIVFYDYNPTGEMLSQLMKSHGIKHLTLNGATKNAIDIERKFRDDPTIRGLLCNSASGSEGINAQVANYEFFYESPCSPITRKQAIARAARQGQTRRVTVTDYVAVGTVDQTILDYISDGLNLMDALKRQSKHAQRALFDR